MHTTPHSALGLHRVLDPAGVLPQTAYRLDASPKIWPSEARINVERLNLDAASYRQLADKHAGDGKAIRAEVNDIIAARGKMHNPVTGSGGMLIGTVAELGPESPLRNNPGLAVGDKVATLVSLTLTPLSIVDELRNWDGDGEQVSTSGHAILFARSMAALLPSDIAPALALAVLDVCGAPALAARVVAEYRANSRPPSVTVLGAAGKSGSLSAAAARAAGATRVVGVVRNEQEADDLTAVDLVDAVVQVDARDPIAVARKVGDPTDITVVCVDVPGCEGSAILTTAPGGTVIFFSMATSFPAAALGAEGLAADVTMLIGNGYIPGHAQFALDLYRQSPGVRKLFEIRLNAE